MWCYFRKSCVPLKKEKEGFARGEKGEGVKEEGSIITKFGEKQE